MKRGKHKSKHRVVQSRFRGHCGPQLMAATWLRHRTSVRSVPRGGFIDVRQPGGSETDSVIKRGLPVLTPLNLFWNSERKDNFTIATAHGAQDAIAAGYKFVRVEGQVHSDVQPLTVPLKLYWNIARGDNLTIATAQAEQDAIAAGYQFVRAEGYIYPTQQLDTVPLRLFWSPDRECNFLTANLESEQSAIAAGYRFVRVEGFVYPSATNRVEDSPTSGEESRTTPHLPAVIENI